MSKFTDKYVVLIEIFLPHFSIVSFHHLTDGVDADKVIPQVVVDFGGPAEKKQERGFGVEHQPFHPLAAVTEPHFGGHDDVRFCGGFKIKFREGIADYFCFH